MIIDYTRGEHEYKIDLSKGRDLTIPIDFSSIGPNCFYAPPPRVEPVIAGDFVGDTTRGGAVNFKNIHLNPHGNGTHTECVGHIATETVFIRDVLRQHHFIGEIISVYPTLLDNGDKVITAQTIREMLTEPTAVVIIRTLPNEEGKQTRLYSGTNPPYFEAEALAYMRAMGVQHFMTDLPSVDREEDGGALAAHKAWWNYPDTLDNERTISEMVFVPDDVYDGTYLINIQTLSIHLDVSPSKIVAYPLIRD